MIQIYVTKIRTSKTSKKKVSKKTSEAKELHDQETKIKAFFLTRGLIAVICLKNILMKIKITKTFWARKLLIIMARIISSRWLSVTQILMKTWVGNHLEDNNHQGNKWDNRRATSKWRWTNKNNSRWWWLKRTKIKMRMKVVILDKIFLMMMKLLTKKFKTLSQTLNHQLYRKVVQTLLHLKKQR